MNRRGFFASVGALSAARAMALASQILVLPILARYLTPSEFGIVALAMSIAVFANMLSDGGMGRSLIRTPLERHAEWSTVFWFLGALGLGLSLLILALTPGMVWLFEEPELFWPLAVLSSMPLILALAAAFNAEMEQREVFGELALAQTVATLLALGVAVAMAVTGFGVWALIVQQILLISMTGSWAVIRSRFRPSLLFSRTDLGPHFRFGRDTVTTSIVAYLQEQSTPLVIGKVIGIAELGIFAMAARFLRLPMFGLAGPAGRVIYVRLTRAQGDLVKFRGILLTATRLLSFLILPGMAAVAMVSETLFVLLLSERWTDVAPVFALAAGGASLIAVTSPAMQALTALGMTMQRLRLTTEITVFWLILLAAGVGFGLLAVAAARTIWMAVMLPRHWTYLQPACGVTAGTYFGALMPGLASASAVGVILGLMPVFLELTGWIFIFASLGVLVAISILVFLIWRRTLSADFARLTG